MSKPFNAKRLLLTPKTWNVLLDVTDNFYPPTITIKGKMGDGDVCAKLSSSECRHLSEFFQLQSIRIDKRKR